MLYFFVLYSGYTIAQDREVIEVSTRDNLNSLVSNDMQYLLPEFSPGYLYYVNSTRDSGKFNYNMLNGEMQFIGPNNTILALANVPDVKMIDIGGRIFYPFKNEEFVEELLATDKMKLQVRRKCDASNMGKKAAYGGYSTTSSITSYRSIERDNWQQNLSETKSMIVKQESFYFLVIENKRIQIKTQQTFTKQFPKHKSAIETFIKENNIRLDKENDLKILVEYCSTL